MKRKILLWLDVFSAHFGMAKLLKEKHDCDIFTIIDINRGRKFYEEQKFIEFTKKWYYRDCFDRTQKKPDLPYLEKIEEKYKINIWKIVYSDINFFKYNEYHKFNYDEILIIIEQECRFFERVLDEVNPDFLAIRITDSSNGQILQKICIAKGIEVLMLGFTRFGNRAYISQEYDYLEFEKKHDEKDIRSFEELHKHIQGITSLQSTFRKKFRNSKKLWIKGAIKYLSLIINNKYREYYTNYGKTFFKVIYVEGKFSLKTRYRKKFIDRNFKRRLEHEQKFIYFPLQLEPERSTLIPATFYTNQLEVITNIAKSIPIDYQLFVKEHPMQKIKGWREISFYKNIMKLLNVKLIHPSISNDEMLKKCAMAMTIAGTTGLEAALYRKPCIVFSNVIYSSLPSVYRLKSLEELPMAIRESLKKEVKLLDVNEFINSLDANSFPFNNTELSIKINNEFFYDGYLFDTEINLKKAEEFLKKNHKYFEILEIQYIKKMNYIKNKENK
jgi:hypothetical protein